MSGAVSLGDTKAHGRASQLLNEMWAEKDDAQFVALAEQAANTKSVLLWGARGQFAGRRLLLLTRHDDPGIAAEAAVLLPAFGVTALEAVPAIVGMSARLARAESEEVRGWGAMGIAFTVGSYFPTSVPILWGMSLHPDPYVRRVSLVCLSVPGQRSVLNVPAVSVALLDWNPKNRRVAANVLGQHQWWSLPALPALAASRSLDPKPKVRHEADYSIRRITTPRL